MKELEKNVMCVLLKQLINNNLITQNVHDHARVRILAALEEDTYFCYAELDRKGEADEYTQNSC